MRNTHLHFLTALPFVFLFLLSDQSNAQVRFDRVDNVAVEIAGTPMQNPWSGGINYPLTSSVDMDGDGRKDLFVFDRFNNRVSCFLNTGSTNVVTAWQYAPEMVQRFPPINKWALFYDYNCDGKEDLFMLSSQFPSGIAAWRNDYTPGSGLQFTLVNPFMRETFAGFPTNIFASAVSIPAFADVDSDGDMDIIGYNSVPDGRFIYHRNLSMDNYGTCDSLVYEWASACWGNFALQVGGANEVGCFHCPCRVGRPTEEPNPVLEPAYDPSDAARRDDTISSIYLLDLDGDNDMDALIGDISSYNTLMVHNGGTQFSAEMDTQDVSFPSYDLAAVFNGFHAHSYIDLDNDGKRDMLFAPNENENRQGMWWYKNTATDPNPTFSYRSSDFLVGGMIDVGEAAVPVPFDYDSDGLPDLIVGGSIFQNPPQANKNSLWLFRNKGTATQPAYELITDDLAGISALNLVAPLAATFGDLDADGDADMIIGADDGKLYFFNNSAGAGNPCSFQLAFPNYMGIDVGNTATPQLFDINRDGLQDLLIGEKSATINYFKNIGTSASAFYSNLPDNDTLGGILLQSQGYVEGYTVPFFYDTAGTRRLAVSNMGGNVYFYDNIDGNLNGTFRLLDSLYNKPESSRIKFNVSVNGGDINGDGFVDLVLGQASGGLQLWYQYNPTAGVPALGEPAVSFIAFPNPARDEVRVSFNHLSGKGTEQLEVTDIAGRVLYRSRVNAEQMVISTTEWASGLYLLRLVSETASRSMKLRVQH